jgi:hypothetical protein
MNKELVPHEQSLELRELGIEVKSPYWYNPNGVLLMKSFECDDETISVNVKDIIEYWDGVIKDRIDALTFSQAFRWFREKCLLEGIVEQANDFYWYKFSIYFYGKENKQLLSKGVEFKTYEDAELECLKKLIEIVKKK